MPCYIYDHSGITISTGSFGCRWDNGQFGYIMITKEKARKETLFRLKTDKKETWRTLKGKVDSRRIEHIKNKYGDQVETIYGVK